MRSKISFLVACGVAGAACAQSDKAIEDQMGSAVRRGDLAAVLALVNAPAGKRERRERTVLMQAALFGNGKIAAAMLDAGARVNEPSSKGLLPLLLAIGGQHDDVIGMLLQRGTNPNLEGKCLEKDCLGHPALPLATYLSDVETVRLLLTRGADPGWHKGWAIRSANVNANVEMWRLLRRATKDSTTDAPQERSTVPIGLTTLEKALPGQKAGPRANERCRLAIVAQADLRAAADLLTSELAAAGAFELLERTDLERVMAERKLIEVFGAETAPRAAAALLGADAVLFIRNREAGGVRAVESRLVRVSPGLVLDSVNAPMPLANPPEWARLLAARIAAQANKAIDPHAVALSLLNVRAAQGRQADRALEAQLTTIVADRLAHQSNCVLLERNAFEQLELEAGADAFWAGKFFVDGTVELPVTGDGDIILRLRLLPAKGGEPRVAEARGTANDPGRLVDAAIPRLVSGLGVQRTQPARDLRAEATRYAQEAEWAMACRMPLLAMRAADTAWALGGRLPELARLRTKTAPQLLLREAARIAVAVREANPVEPGDPDPVHDLLRHKDRPPDAFTAAEFIEVAMRGLDAWRDSPSTDRESIAAGVSAVHAAGVALILFDTAEMLDRYEPALDDLRVRLRSALDMVLSRAGELPEQTDLLAWLCEFAARNLALWARDTDQWMKSARMLLTRHFSKDDARVRVRVRLALLDGDLPSVEEHLSWQEDIPGQASGGTCWISRPARTPRKIFAALAREFKNADNLEDRAFALCAAFRAQAYGFRNPDLFPPAQAAVEELSKKFSEDKQTAGAALAMFSHGLAEKSRRPPLAAQAPPGTQTVDAALPVSNDLPVARLSWRTPQTSAEFTEEAQLRTESLVWAEDSLWAYIRHRHKKTERGSIVRIAVPELRTLERIDLPPLPAANTRIESFRVLVTPKRLIVLALGRWIAFADRPNGNWHVEPGVPPLDAVALTEDQDVLFVGTDDQHGEGVVRFDLGRRSSELLVSTRRVPSQSPLDQAALRIARIYFNTQGELVVTAMAGKGVKSTAAWLPNRQTPWRVVDRTVEEPIKAESRFVAPGWRASGYLKRRSDAETVRGIIEIRRSDAPANAGGALIRAERLPREDFEPGWVEKNPGLDLPSMWHLTPRGYVMTNSNAGGALWFLPETELPLTKISTSP